MRFGIDRLARLGGLVQRLRGERVGVLAHAASVNRELSHVLDVLGEIQVTPRVLFGPEHGFGGAAQDMAPVGDGRAGQGGTAIVSLYGERLEDLAPPPASLAEIDLLLVDLVDVGARYYTFVWTALLAVRAALRAGVHVVVLDRPNPLGGSPAQVEGQTQQAGFLSFVGLEPVPIRHGLTVAEMVLLQATGAQPEVALGPDGALSVVGVEGWERDVTARGWDRPFVLPSPNMPTAKTALVYPGGCLLEGTNLSEGRGHTRPFEVVGAPWLDGRRLAAALQGGELEGFVARPLEFIPTFHKHAGQICGGVQIHPVDEQAFRPVATYVALVGLARQLAPEAFRFRTERYEFVDHIPAFDLLTGSDRARLALNEGQDPRLVAQDVSRSDPSWGEQMAVARQLVSQASWGA